MRPKHRSENPEEDLGKRPAAVNEHDRGAETKSWKPAFPVGVRNRSAEAGCANPVSLLRIASLTAEIASLGKISPSPQAWIVGSGIIRPDTNAPHRVQRAGFCEPFIVSAQKQMFHGGVLREFGVVAR